MKVKDLIRLLKQYEDYFEVKIYNENWGNSVDIKDVFLIRKTYEAKEIVEIKCDMKGL